jgi:hypothetical protein
MALVAYGDLCFETFDLILERTAADSEGTVTVRVHGTPNAMRKL